jgi:multidrug efflux pump subunit AcrA (membrane-fusion protein)
VLVPTSAIQRNAQGDTVVWVVSDSRVHQQRIETGGTVGDRVRVTSGLSGGEAVVVSGAPTADGQRVTVN